MWRKVIILSGVIVTASWFGVGALLEADYFIQSVRDHAVCIEGGAIGSRDGGSLYVTGEMGGGICQNKPEQHWHFQPAEPSGMQRNGRSNLYNITSAASEDHYSSALNANITGYFIKYWPNPVQLIHIREGGGGGAQEGANRNIFMIRTSGDHPSGCFQSGGKLKKLKVTACRENSTEQRWRLRLVTYGEVSW